MAKIFGFSTDRLRSSFDSMTDREKAMTIGFVALLALILVGGGMFWAISKTAARRAEIASGQKTIGEILALAPQYEAARKRNEAVVKAAEANTSVYAPVQEAARSLGLTLMPPGVPQPANTGLASGPKGQKELFSSELVKFAIGKLSIDKLTAFLTKFEGENRDGVRKIMQLKIELDRQTPNELNVSMVAQNWQKKL